MSGQQADGWFAAFALIYFTFFLDNVLLTVLVPIIPEWTSGEAEAAGGGRRRQALAGAVLGAKAAAQLAAAAPAARAVAARGPAAVLRAGTAAMALAAAVLPCGPLAGGRAALALAGAARAAHGAGAAAASVAGLALAAGEPRAPLAALLGAVALGVLLGYPLGGVVADLWGGAAPFLVVALALLLDLAMQCVYLGGEEYNRVAGRPGAGRGVWGEARRGAAGACAGAVFLSTSVMAALEPCLPPWLAERMRPAPRGWQRGLAFVPDSAAYFVSASALGGVARRAGAERVALAGLAAVAAAALCVPLARSLPALAAPHALLGAGLGAVDAALVPALMTRADPHRRLAVAALLQTASSAAYVAGPVAGGALAAWASFPCAMSALGVANLLYAAYLYRALAADPLSDQWGARSPDADESDAGVGAGAAAAGGGELTPLNVYSTLR